jgi:hypothetical protein
MGDCHRLCADLFVVPHLAERGGDLADGGSCGCGCGILRCTRLRRPLHGADE